MSHNTGTIQTPPSPIAIGPDSGGAESPANTWAVDFIPDPAPTGTKFVILHFQNANLPGSNTLEVDLGYGTDVFDASDGPEFWTRPINLSALGGASVPIRYIAPGAATGSVELDRYGRGERLLGTQDPTSFSNSDPFLVGGDYDEPNYDPFWFCNTPPAWQNTACIPAGDIRRTVANSVGMIVTVHADGVSTCSVTCIGPDTVITAGHCLADPENEAATSSVIFGYEPNCDGSRPGGYGPQFFKVNRVLKFRNEEIGDTYYDYCILQLETPPGGIGIPAITLRDSLPAVGEQVYGIHHPNGAVKKLAAPHPVFETVNSRDSGGIWVDIDVSGGSSGSGLFDTAGRIVGVLSNGVSCALRYFPTSTILQDIAATPTPAASQDVMLVLDRSGSMSGSDGAGSTKIESLRDAASLFIQLIRSNDGHRAGMVSFSSAPSSPVDFSLSPVNPGTKNQLIGPAPYSGGEIGAVTPGGNTSIGGGLEAGNVELASGSSPGNLLLMTDGLQNTPPMIESVVGALAGTTVHVIGFGNESNLDGELLSQLAQQRNGLYKRAGTGLELRKFFALAFGDIFEAGALLDPQFELGEQQQEGEPIEFSVCDETALTAIVGWNNDDALLEILVETPAGAVISGSTAGDSSTGKGWSFLRIPLPHNGEREGIWSIRVRRPTLSGDDVQPHRPRLTYFANIVASGGPSLRPLANPARLYTGADLNPRVELKYPGGAVPHDATVALSVTRPDDGAGNLLTAHHLGPATRVSGDDIHPRQSTLTELQNSGTAAIEYVTETFALSDAPRDTEGFFEHSGVFGRRLADLLRMEGNYTFRAVANYGHECPGSREVTWTAYVATSIDPDNTVVTTSVLETLPDGKQKIRATFIPRDRFGNHVGPGRSDSIDVTDAPGTVVSEPPQDNGDGSYDTTVIWDPASGHPPGLSLGQPDRPAVCVTDDTRAPRTGGLPWWLLWVLLAVILGLLLLLLFY